jgi:hypothetical protein
MPRYELPRTPKGFRHPGSGRPKGMPNPVSVEARELVRQMVNDAQYQARLRRDFALRKLHPTIESLVWAYAIGKPRQDIQVTGNIDVSARLEHERRILLQLDVAELEQLAMESQQLIDRAEALATARNGGVLPQHLVVSGENGAAPESSAELLRNIAGSDNLGSVNYSSTQDSDENLTRNSDDTTTNADPTDDDAA